MSNLYLDFHILQTVGPANINRDDSGSPKSAVFGGVRRARVSSQAWKRAIRKDFEKFLDRNDLGERTMFAVDRIAEAIIESNPELADRAQELAKDALTASGIKVQAPKKKEADADATRPVTGYLLFLARRQIQALAKLAVESAESGKVDKKQAKAAVQDQHSIDVSLFGRMIADAPELNADACCQVAHAIGVHASDTEFDYFTAVDDNAPEDNAGAGMIGTVEFVSSTLYRYATINVTELIKNLGSQEAAVRAVEAFAQSLITSMPTGKQNTFANRTRPELALLSVRSDQPVNFVEAFETAITNTSGRVTEATRKLAEHAFESDEAYGSEPETCVFLATGGATAAEAISALEKLGNKVNLPELISTAGDAVRNIKLNEDA
ncbi:type I-E CRISPR-associated protein Cas7/Cse4/CasC [Corynebacterium canis]|uniref:Type I-E CRISPR-associated protein Cas7/Cse4/CasC n=1 Tax=Corynebacterium canis TaxID=679663 RepID=A0A5C5UMB2_9CORY|nr:type I-E CRISPR-associated protein Cas7/Cse4/CasC [Corynebacterium canis]TWT26485.1 type I-E CRISPR-associated protein Cas7/Cse4/CasC [Corynebacterium canis]WJY76046.1 CRISPR system Cascade subunit CasC [Corynebacterium canis]